jgi:prophage antirepressor-like protein
MKTTELILIRPAGKAVDSAFPFKGTQIHVYTIGEQLIFILQDLCKCLEISNVSQTAQVCKEKEKVYVKHISGQEVLGVTESGLYRIILRSNKPNAEAFQDLVSETILPTIRKTGRYVANESTLALSQPTDRMFKIAASVSRSVGIKRQVETSDKFSKWNTAVELLSDVLADREEFETYRYNKRFMCAIRGALSNEFRATRGKAPPIVKRKRPSSLGLAYPPSFKPLVAEFFRGWQSREQSY